MLCGSLVSAGLDSRYQYQSLIFGSLSLIKVTAGALFRPPVCKVHPVSRKSTGSSKSAAFGSYSLRKPYEFQSKGETLLAWKSVGQARKYSFTVLS